MKWHQLEAPPTVEVRVDDLKMLCPALRKVHTGCDGVGDCRHPGCEAERRVRAIVNERERNEQKDAVWVWRRRAVHVARERDELRKAIIEFRREHDKAPIQGVASKDQPWTKARDG